MAFFAGAGSPAGRARNPGRRVLRVHGTVPYFHDCSLPAGRAPPRPSAPQEQRVITLSVLDADGGRVLGVPIASGDSAEWVRERIRCAFTLPRSAVVELADIRGASVPLSPHHLTEGAVYQLRLKPTLLPASVPPPQQGQQPPPPPQPSPSGPSRSQVPPLRQPEDTPQAASRRPKSPRRHSPRGPRQAQVSFSVSGGASPDAPAPLSVSAAPPPDAAARGPPPPLHVDSSVEPPMSVGMPRVKTEPVSQKEQQRLQQEEEPGSPPDPSARASLAVCPSRDVSVGSSGGTPYAGTPRGDYDSGCLISGWFGNVTESVDGTRKGILGEELTSLTSSAQHQQSSPPTTTQGSRQYPLRKVGSALLLRSLQRQNTMGLDSHVTSLMHWSQLRRGVRTGPTTTMRYLWSTLTKSVTLLSHTHMSGRPAERSPEAQLAGASSLMELYTSASAAGGSVLKELLGLLVAPRDSRPDTVRYALSKLARTAHEQYEKQIRPAAAGGGKKGLAELLCLALYTHEGRDLDRLLGWPGVPDPLASVAVQDAYDALFQQKRQRNPVCSPTVPSWALGAPYRIANWAARAAFASGDSTFTEFEKSAAREELKRWVFFVSVMFATAEELCADRVTEQLNDLLGMLGENRDMHLSKQRVQARLAGASAAVRDKVMWRGVCGLSGTDFRELSQLGPGARVGWVTPASATLSSFVAYRFARVPQPVPVAEALEDLPVRMIPEQGPRQPFLGVIGGRSPAGITVQWLAPQEGGPPDGFPRKTLESYAWWQNGGEPTTWELKSGDHAQVNNVLYQMNGVTHATPLWYLSQYPEELEVLLPPFADWEVVKPPEILPGDTVLITLRFAGWCGAGLMKPFVARTRRDLAEADSVLRQWQAQDVCIIFLSAVSDDVLCFYYFDRLRQWATTRLKHRRAFYLMLSLTDSQTTVRWAFQTLRRFCWRRLIGYKAEVMALRQIAPAQRKSGWYS
eukprot:TRINITY_DN19454_c0_g1_i1.p1 TRINITY_DN19454_c0_g1~~TRINITY_DN19454_c0_g1_i1.p1  ORF type:complete len:989 (+),score=178.71 TRINITY_DN19454_c0_g1_i1:67-2967(+)